MTLIGTFCDLSVEQSILKGRNAPIWRQREPTHMNLSGTDRLEIKNILNGRFKNESVSYKNKVRLRFWKNQLGSCRSCAEQEPTSSDPNMSTMCKVNENTNRRWYKLSCPADHFAVDQKQSFIKIACKCPRLLKKLIYKYSDLLYELSYTGKQSIKRV